MNYIIDKLLYVNANLVIIYLADRHFNVVTTNGTALALAMELLYPPKAKNGIAA